MPNSGNTGTNLKKRLWYDAVLDRGLNPVPTEIEASILQLGYRVGGFQLGTQFKLVRL